MFRLPHFGLPATHIRRAIGSLAASSGMHALLLATLAVAVVKAHPGAEAPEPLTSSAGQPIAFRGPDAAGIDGSLAGDATPQHGVEAAFAASAARQPDAQPNGRQDGGGIDAERFLLPTAADVEVNPAELLPEEPRSLVRLELPGAEPNEGELRAAGDEQPAAGAGGEGRPGGGHSFFGLEATGDRVVFVVDISGSMHGRRFFRARNELRHSIESLRENQQFFVIFFNNDALPMPAERLLPATADNVGRTIDWLKYVECGGGTNPLPGLLLALQLHPDSIYLLSDGKFDPQVVWEVAQAEQLVPIPIYTIGFASRAAEKLLKSIAKETGGSYRFVR